MQRVDQSNTQHGASAKGDASQSKKRKRNRTVLSCLPCKQRKVKCSRNIPCTACTKRGAIAECRWADKEFEPPKQVFALDSVMDSLREHFEARINHLEGLLNVQASSHSSDVTRRALTEAYANNDGAFDVQAGGSTSMMSRYSESPEASQSGDEAAGAAFALEVLAGGDQPNLPDGFKLNPSMGELIPLEEFARYSVLAGDTNNRLEGNSRIPLLGFLNKRNITDSILACLQTKEPGEKLLNSFFSTIGWIYAALNATQFRAEYQAFWDHVMAGHREFDLPWLANLCIILAIALQSAQEQVSLGAVQPEDLYQLSKLCLEFAEWRRCPTRRVVITLFMSSMYMNNENDMNCSRDYLYEAMACALALGYHQLGDDPSVMPKPDISVQDGSLIARESAVRMFWDIITQDWIGLTLDRHPMISPSSFNTTWPRNFNENTLATSRWDTPPITNAGPTDSLIHIGKTYTAVFVRKIFDLGQPPTEDLQLQQYYNKMLQLESEYVGFVDRYHVRKSSWTAAGQDDWRLLVGSSGVNCRRMRVHRPFMVRGYRDPERFGKSTRVCVESALEVLEMLRRLEEQGAPHLAIWFLSRHLLAAVTTIFIDVLHDADVGIAAEISDRKLIDIPYVVNWFTRAEQSPIATAREMGMRGRLLITALQDAKEARRKTGGGTKQDYGRVLKEIAANVKRSSTTTTPAYSNTASPVLPPATINWLDDPETRKLLSSLGLLDTTSQWQHPAPGVQAADNQYPLNITTSLDFANTFDAGFALLDSYAM